MGVVNKENRESLQRRSSVASEHRPGCFGYTVSVGYVRVILRLFFRLFKTNMPVYGQG